VGNKRCRADVGGLEPENERKENKGRAMMERQSGKQRSKKKSNVGKHPICS